MIVYPCLSFGIGDVYPSYTNSEKDRAVCRPSREDGVHDGFDRKMQAVKMADVWGVEKDWAAIYESCRQHGDFKTYRSNRPSLIGNFSALRAEESYQPVVGRT